MRGKKNFWTIALALLVAVGLVLPAMAQEKKAQGKETMAEFFKKERENLCGELKLSPDKAKEFMAIGDKYDQKRKEIIEKIKKNEADLKAAVNASPPDDAKIKSVVDDAVANQEQLFDTFKDQRKEEMALLTPLQQAKYLLTLMKWHRTVYEKKK